MRVLLVLLLSHSVFAQTPDTSNFACVKELEVPGYPGIARATSTQGDVTARIELGDNGRVLAVHTSSPDDSPIAKILATVIENHVPFGKYDAACNGKTVTLIFRFQIAVDRRPTAGYTYPNVFLISANSEPFQK
ncbi:MAG: hypothetical protein ABIR70_09940 [Bryobacteraceae bacterium]